MEIDKRQVNELESALIKVGWSKARDETLGDVWSYEGGERTDLIRAAALTIRGLTKAELKVEPKMERRGLISRLIGRGDAVEECD